MVRNLWLVMLCVAIGTSLAYVNLSWQAKIYEADASAIVSPNAYVIEANDPEQMLLDVLDVARYDILGTYVQFFRSREITDGARAILIADGYDEDIVDDAIVEIQPISNSFVIRVDVRAEDPEVAQALADEIIQQIIIHPPLPALSTLFPIQVLDSAERPSDPVSPDVKLGLMLGFGSSLILGIGLAFAWDGFLTVRRKRRAQIENT